MTKKSSKPAEKYARQRAYTDAQRAAGEQVKLTVDLKAEADVAAFRALQARFPDLSNAAIAKLALRELAAKKNKR